MGHGHRKRNENNKISVGQGQSDPIGVSAMPSGVLAVFQNVGCLVPKGSYEMKISASTLRLRGKTHTYNIPISSIRKLCVIPESKGTGLNHRVTNTRLVIEIKPPIQKGKTIYDSLVFQFPEGEKKTFFELNMTANELKRLFGDRLKKTQSGTTSKIISRIIHVVSNVGISKTSNFFKDLKGEYVHSVKCFYKTCDGFLTFLRDGLIFPHNPPLSVAFSDIHSMYLDVEESAVTKYCSLVIDTSDGRSLTLKTISKEVIPVIKKFILAYRLPTKPNATWSSYQSEKESRQGDFENWDDDVTTESDTSSDSSSAEDDDDDHITCRTALPSKSSSSRSSTCRDSVADEAETDFGNEPNKNASSYTSQYFYREAEASWEYSTTYVPGAELVVRVQKLTREELPAKYQHLIMGNENFRTRISRPSSSAGCVQQQKFQSKSKVRILSYIPKAPRKNFEITCGKKSASASNVALEQVPVSFSENAVTHSAANFGKTSKSKSDTESKVPVNPNSKVRKRAKRKIRTDDARARLEKRLKMNGKGAGRLPPTDLSASTSCATDVCPPETVSKLKQKLLETKALVDIENTIAGITNSFPEKPSPAKPKETSAVGSRSRLAQTRKAATSLETPRPGCELLAPIPKSREETEKPLLEVLIPAVDAVRHFFDRINSENVPTLGCSKSPPLPRPQPHPFTATRSVCFTRTSSSIRNNCEPRTSDWSTMSVFAPSTTKSSGSIPKRPGQGQNQSKNSNTPNLTELIPEPRGNQKLKNPYGLLLFGNQQTGYGIVVLTNGFSIVFKKEWDLSGKKRLITCDSKGHPIYHPIGPCLNLLKPCVVCDFCRSVGHQKSQCRLEKEKQEKSQSQQRRPSPRIPGLGSFSTFTAIRKQPQASAKRSVTTQSNIGTRSKFISFVPIKAIDATPSNPYGLIIDSHTGFGSGTVYIEKDKEITFPPKWILNVNKRIHTPAPHQIVYYPVGPCVDIKNPCVVCHFCRTFGHRRSDCPYLGKQHLPDPEPTFSQYFADHWPSNQYRFQQPSHQHYQPREPFNFGDRFPNNFHGIPPQLPSFGYRFQPFQQYNPFYIPPFYCKWQF